jgi:DUF4097 and DUF4098 domain-containing protein YvlB
MRRTEGATLAGATVVLAAAMGLSACDIVIGAAGYRVREEKKFTVTGAPRVMLKTFNGPLEIRGWDRQEILVEIEKSGPDQVVVGAIQVKAEQRGNEVTIDVQGPTGVVRSDFRNPPRASVTISLPVTSSIEARSGDGPISIRRVTGKVDLHSGDGPIEGEEIKGDLLARTGDGPVSLKRIEGTADVETRDGPVEIDGVKTAVTIDTGDGPISLEARKGSVMAAAWSVTTRDGGIEASLPSGFAAEIDAQAAGGRVRVDGLTDKNAERPDGDEHERQAVRGSLGTGGKPLRLRTGDGPITVRVW